MRQDETNSNQKEISLDQGRQEAKSSMELGNDHGQRALLEKPRMQHNSTTSHLGADDVAQCTIGLIQASVSEWNTNITTIQTYGINVYPYLNNQKR